VPAGVIDRGALVALEEAYGVEHDKTYGHRAGADEPVELVTLKVVGRGVPEVLCAALGRGPDRRKVLSSPSRCGMPISVRPMAGEKPDLVESLEGLVSSRNTIRPASSHRLDREPRPLWQHRYRCAGDGTLMRIASRRTIRCAVEF
jgi:hypothetical protein